MYSSSKRTQVDLILDAVATRFFRRIEKTLVTYNVARDGILCCHSLIAVEDFCCSFSAALLANESCNVGGECARLCYVRLSIGLWCKKLIKKGSRFGPFIGDKALEVDDHMDPTFIWEVSR
jgi:hypothetical protein